MRRRILTESQRQAIEEYLRDLPLAMPDLVRQMRSQANRMDFEQFEADIRLLKDLRDLEVRMGRPPNSDYVDQKAKFIVRHKGERDIKGALNMRKKK